METIERQPVDWRSARIAEILERGRPATSAEELYGPGPGPDDPEDLEFFLALWSRSARPFARSELRGSLD